MSREFAAINYQVLNELKGGVEVSGAALSNPEPVLSVRTK